MLGSSISLRAPPNINSSAKPASAIDYGSIRMAITRSMPKGFGNGGTGRASIKHEGNASLAPASILGAPGIGEGAQRFQEDDQVGLFAHGQVPCAGALPVVGVQTHDLGDRLHIAVVAVGRR